MRIMLKNKRGEGYLDVVVGILCLMFVIAFSVNLFPVFMVKQELNTFATELAREAEMAGKIGSKTTAKETKLRSNLGIDPTVSWSKTGRIQLDEETELTITITYDVGFFRFGSFPITLTSKAIAKSEVYWK